MRIDEVAYTVIQEWDLYADYADGGSFYDEGVFTPLDRVPDWVNDVSRILPFLDNNEIGWLHDVLDILSEKEGHPTIKSGRKIFIDRVVSSSMDAEWMDLPDIARWLKAARIGHSIDSFDNVVNLARKIQAGVFFDMVYTYCAIQAGVEDLVARMPMPVDMNYRLRLL